MVFVKKGLYNNMMRDIAEKLHSDFGPKADEAINMIEAFQTNDNTRILRCVVYLADGNINSLKAMIDLATIDYRDVIYQAEYDCADQRKRDFNQPFEQSE